MKKLFGIFVALCMLSACSTVEVNENPEIVHTQIAQTVIADYTQQAQAQLEATPTDEPAPTEAPQFGTRNNPVPLGQPIDLVYDGIANFQMTVLEIHRGQTAWTMVNQANMFNDPPIDGMEYIVAKIGIRYQTSTDPDYQLSIDGFSFKSVSMNQVVETPSIVDPEPRLDLTLFPGGNGEGFITVTTYVDDPAPLIVYEEWLSFNSTPIYLATN